MLDPTAGSRPLLQPMNAPRGCGSSTTMPCSTRMCWHAPPEWRRCSSAGAAPELPVPMFAPTQAAGVLSRLLASFALQIAGLISGRIAVASCRRGGGGFQTGDFALGCESAGSG